VQPRAGEELPPRIVVVGVEHDRRRTVRPRQAHERRSAARRPLVVVQRHEHPTTGDAVRHHG